jgi:hypothetical protein
VLVTTVLVIGTGIGGRLRTKKNEKYEIPQGLYSTDLPTKMALCDLNRTRTSTLVDTTRT